MNLWPFKPSTLLDTDTQQWHVDIACWFLRNCGDTLPRSPARLILPGDGFYRLTEPSGPALARQIFEQTKTFAGLETWVVDLVADDAKPLDADIDAVEPANDFHNHAATPWIAYSSRWHDDPFRMVSWFARALGQMLVDAIDEAPPCEDAHRAAAADTVAGLLGFGVFLADEMILTEFKHIDRVDPNAALSEPEFVFDIALFLTVHGLPAEGAQRFLKPSLAEKLKPALRDAAVFRPALLEAQAAARSV